MGTLVEKNRDLFDLANEQQGLFTAKQAEQVGFVSNNHSYHVKTGNWIREGRGLYRLAHFPKSPEEQKVIYALWSQNRDGEIQGVYSHETALAHYEISDVNPSKLHMYTSMAIECDVNKDLNQGFIYVAEYVNKIQTT